MGQFRSKLLTEALTVSGLDWPVSRQDCFFPYRTVEGHLVKILADPGKRFDKSDCVVL